MHYKDGTEAKVGDLVKGTVYNTKTADGSPAIIVGVMLGITPGSSACNCRVGVLRSEPLPGLALPPEVFAIRTHEGEALVHKEHDGATLLRMKVDYSQCDHLELVHRPAG